jgi:hypothetical protein
MSSGACARDVKIVGDFTDLVDAANSGLLPSSKKQRRSRGGLKQRFNQAALLAPLLATEGCLTLGDEGGAIDGGGDGSAPPPLPGSAVQAVDDSNFHADTDGDLFIAPKDLLENDQVAQGVTLEIVRVYGATHGEVTLLDGLIYFKPEAGYEGMATFYYEVRDSNGNVSQASVEIHVGMEDMDGGHGGHGDGGMDPVMHGMHIAIMELVPIEDATHVAINNGSWFDPNTWASGEVPGDGARVLIPEGVEVQYDGESPVSLFTVRVDGALEFATDQDTFMEVDTMVIAPTGRLTIGTVDNPVAAGVQTVIQIADNGPIDVDWDPSLVSRGIVSNGEVEIHGAYKDTFLKVAEDPMAGDTSMTLESVPEGWRVGDRLVLTGTHLTESPYTPGGEARDLTTEDEELVITSIVGNVIHFDRPLQYNHEGARDDLKAYVANYTRNVRVETENADDLPVYQRGHVMLMMSDNIDVRYAEFSELGRTDKSERAFDIEDIENPAFDSNVKARYSLHLHRVGVDDIDNPAMIVGNSVWGSPGWGYVHHDSNAIMADNAAYDTWGAGFVAETGNEIGRWSHNISIKTVGTGGGAKWHEDVNAFDLGRTGANFWFQGRLVDAVDNVAAGSPGGHGFVYMSRGEDMIDVLVQNADLPETLHYVKTALVNKPAISQFEGNEAIAVQTGLEVIKASPYQDHDDWTEIKDFLGWEVADGIHLQYTAHYTLINSDLVGASGEGGAFGKNGIHYGSSTLNIVVNGAVIDGFENGISYTKNIPAGVTSPFYGKWDYIFIDVDFDNNGIDMPDYNPAEDTILTSADLLNGDLSFNPDFDGIFEHPTGQGGGAYLDLSGVKTDSIGVTPTSSWDKEHIQGYYIDAAILQEGYWQTADGRIVTQIEQYFSDRATGEIDKITNYVYWGGNLARLEEAPEFRGLLDLDSNAPIGRDDFYTTGVEEDKIMNVLSNDYDPDGDGIRVDGIVQPSHGQVFLNDNGTLTYSPDPNFSGTDEFWYWVEDDNGKFDKAHVTVTVEV